MPVEFKDKTGVDIEPGDTVRVIIDVVVESVENTREGSVISYADRQRGKMYVACDQVEKRP